MSQDLRQRFARYDYCEPKGKVVRVRMYPKMVENIDREAARQGISRSAFIRYCVVRCMREEELKQ